MVFYYIIEIELSILLELQKSLPAIPGRLGKERWRIDKLSAAAGGMCTYSKQTEPLTQRCTVHVEQRSTKFVVQTLFWTMFVNETMAVNQEKGIFDL